MSGPPLWHARVRAALGEHELHDGDEDPNEQPHHRVDAARCYRRGYKCRHQSEALRPKLPP